MAAIQIIENPERQHWAGLLARPVFPSGDLEAGVRRILDDVRNRGDKAVDEYSLQFDKIQVGNRKVQESEFESAEKKLDEGLKKAIRQAKENIEKFHRNQLIVEPPVEIQPGIRCWRKSVAIEKVGLYIPGGTAPLFSTLLMLGVPANTRRLRRNHHLHTATTGRICSPGYFIYRTDYWASGKFSASVVFRPLRPWLMELKPFRGYIKSLVPGNQWVTQAKKIIQQEGLAIDMPAGPSELAVYADETAVPAYVAADLLSQCEHGPDSQVILATGSRVFAEQVNGNWNRRSKNFQEKLSLKNHWQTVRLFLMRDPAAAMDLLNAYAPEHLILVCRRCRITGRIGA